jgi:hypothetical protein
MVNRVTTDEQMLVSAVRYALGRATYIVEMTAGAVRAAWPSLSEKARAVILRDIAEALSDAVRRSRHLGMDIDHRVWDELMDELRAAADDGDLTPDHGYPSTDELAVLRTFRGTARELIEFTQSIWRNGAGTDTESFEDRWGRTHHRVTFVTGGWSGCEDVIGALNDTLARMYAAAWSKGGRWVFEFPDFVWDASEPWDWAFRQADETEEPRQLLDLRDRLAHLQQQVAGHDAYLTSMMSVADDPTQSPFIDASLDLYSRLHVNEQTYGPEIQGEDFVEVGR